MTIKQLVEIIDSRLMPSANKLTEDLVYFRDPESRLAESIDLSLYEEALQHLKWYVVETEYGGSYIAMENWNNALEQEKLSIFNEEVA